MKQNKEKFLIIGLTGQSGAGKGEVSSIFSELGIPQIDTDKVYHSLLFRGTSCADELWDYFGDIIFACDGSVNRKALADIVFAPENKHKLEKLNQITHKHVLTKTLELIERYKSQGVDGVIVDAPLLFEARFEKICDICISVVAPYEVRLARIMERDKIDQPKAEARLRAQNDEEFYRCRSSIVISNDGSFGQLRSEVERIYLAIMNGNNY